MTVIRYAKMDMNTQLLDKLLMKDTVEGSSSPVEGGSRRVRAPTIRRLPSSLVSIWYAIVDDVDLRRKIAVEDEYRKAERMAAKATRWESKAKCLKMLENVERIIVLEMQRSSKSMVQDDDAAEVLGAAVEEVKRRKYVVEEEVAKQVQSKNRLGPRTCVFFMFNAFRGVRELVAGLRADMTDVMFIFLCEEPGHQHFVENSYLFCFSGLLGEECVWNLEPLLGSGLQVVTRLMSTLAGQLTDDQLDSVALPNLGAWGWDLRAIDVEKLGKRWKDGENVEVLKRAEDSASQWLLSELVFYKSYGLMRVRYKVTEEGNCPGYSRGSVAWLCQEHLSRGVVAGILESYPMKYVNPELNLQQ